MNNTESVDQLLREGGVAEQFRDYETAEKSYKKAIEQDPAHYDAHECLRSAYVNQGKYAQAEELMKSGVKSGVYHENDLKWLLNHSKKHSEKRITTPKRDVA